MATKGNFKIGEQLVTVTNPCPATMITDTYKRANLRRTRVKDGLEFSVEITTGDTPEVTERYELTPGDSITVPRRIADDILADKGHRGICMVDPKDPFQSMIRGLGKAVDHFTLNGEQAMLKSQDSLGYTEDQMRAFRNKFAPFILNQTKAEVLLEKIDQLQQERDEWMKEQNVINAEKLQEEHERALLANEAEIVRQATELAKLKETLTKIKKA